MSLQRVSTPDVLRTQPEAASSMAEGVRAAGESISDAHSSLSASATPSSWSGDAATAASNQFTVVSGDLDSTVAALTKGVTALDAYEETLKTLFSRRIDLVEQVGDLNSRIDAYDRDVAGSDKEDEAAQEALITRSQGLEREATALQAKVDAWNRDQDTADDTVVAALQGVDTVAEGDTAADEAGRPDPVALAQTLQNKVDSGNPESVAAFWRGLSPAQQQALLMHSPELVGNAGGVPASARDEANRASVQSDIDYLGQRESDGQLTSEQEEQLANARDAQKTLDSYRNRLDPETGEPLAHLLIYRPNAFDGDGGVALSLGNPDTADDVTSFIPGLTSEADSLSSNAESMDQLMQQADAKNGDRTVAAITWIDYDAPSDPTGDPLDYLQVATEGKAEDGGQRFSDFVAGLRASDQGPDAHFTAIGHSYGSTTLSHAATDTMLDVDDMVLIGSPGTGSAENAMDLMANGHVYVGSADYDPVSLLGSPGLGALGNDPSQASFGAHRFEVDPGSYRVQDLLDNHSSYFNQGSTSLDAMSDVVAGQTPDEVDGRSEGSYQTLDQLVSGSTVVSGGEQVWNGVEWVGGEVSDGAGWVWDQTTDLADSIWPFN